MSFVFPSIVTLSTPSSFWSWTCLNWRLAIWFATGLHVVDIRARFFPASIRLFRLHAIPYDRLARASTIYYESPSSTWNKYSSRFEVTRQALGSQWNCCCLVCVLQPTQLYHKWRSQISGRCARLHKHRQQWLVDANRRWFRIQDGVTPIYTPVVVELRGATSWSW